MGWEWLTAGNFHVGLSILLDPVSVFMMLIVAGVGFLIVAYSVGYMDGDDEERRYFAYMALFVFSMLLLVQSGNLLILLAGWGLVGLSSYLLIGFWHERPSAIAAAKKAFIVNAFGDATFAIALFLLIQHTGTLDFGLAADRAQGLSSTVVNLVALGLLGGAVAKSAQLPLQTWLPDAMEGPTPVSALIHAATMVTAGVFLIVRTHAFFELAPVVQDLAAGLGAATILLAGLVALVQTDIKRVIAYSTMSQIGYMFLAVGIGAYANGMFHLMTHAFFKALLFMAAGIVIHSLMAEQDMRKMGGLRKYLPKTYIAFLAGSLALVAIPTFSGFFSKDSILAASLAEGTYGAVLWVVGIAGAVLTGIYTFRMLFMVWGGEPSAFVREHFHALKKDVVGDLDGLDGGDPRGAGDVRRLDPVRAVLDSDLEMDRPRRAVPCGRVRLAGGRVEPVRCRRRRARNLDRVGDVLAPLDGGAALRGRAERPRAQVLLRRAVRRRLLQAGGRALARPCLAHRSAAPAVGRAVRRRGSVPRS